MDDDALHRRETELRQRELELRIRELENEVKSRGASAHAAESASFTDAAPGADRTPPPVTPTSKYQENKHQQDKQTRWQKWNGKLWMGLQFGLIMIAVIAAIRIANWLGGALLIGMIAWVGYKVFFETD